MKKRPSIAILSFITLGLFTTSCGTQYMQDSLTAQAASEARKTYLFELNEDLRPSLQQSCYGLLFVWASPEQVETVSKAPYVLRARVSKRLAERYEKATIAVSGTNEVYRCMTKTAVEDGGSVSKPKDLESQLRAVSCVQSVSPERIMGIPEMPPLPGPNTTGDWNVVVKDGVSAKACARQIRQEIPGVVIEGIFENIGILSVKG